MKSVMSIDLRTQRRKEVELYQPVKSYLEGLGYSVKGEIGGCDLVGLREDDRVVIIGELKLSFNLELVLQAVDRLPCRSDERHTRAGRASAKALPVAWLWPPRDQLARQSGAASVTGTLPAKTEP
jgi:hypothetical protein